jgi:two-component system sensor histidine kinase UhpB
MQTEYRHKVKSNFTFDNPPVTPQETRHAGQKGSWQWDMKTDITIWSEQLYRIAGFGPDVAIPSFREHSLFYTSESWDRLTVAVLEVFKTGTPYELELQMRRPDGTTRTIIGRGEAVRDATNDILQLRGTVEDISEHKWGGVATQSERALRTGAIDHWTKRLIDAHEEEKARISRELTDDVCQRLSLLAIEIQQVVPAFPESMAKAQARNDELWRQTIETIDKISRVSQELHPVVLDFVGLDVAIRGLCRDFSKQCKIQVQCNAKAPAGLHKRLALSFFRICQESLRNIARHSEAKNVRIELTVSSQELLLCVSDDGVGIESEQAKRASGFGFVRMEEQLHLIGGQLGVWSQPSFGTRLEARAPLKEPAWESDAA